MIVIKNENLVGSYDYFTRNGKGSFNLKLYAEILKAKGKDVQSQVEFINSNFNIKKS